jgi:thiamine-phosphate pyrophosphorylase
MLITCPKPACGRPLPDVVRECVAAGVTAIQLRDKCAEARELAVTAETLLAITRPAGVLLIVNDRVDVALAVGADGVHLGPDDLPVAAARGISPPSFILGYSTDDPEIAVEAARQGADYLGVGAVFGTRSKPGLAHEAIGTDRVEAVLRAAGLPCVGIGGIDADNATAVFATGAGVAVISSVMGAGEPAAAVRAILRTSTD